MAAAAGTPAAAGPAADPDRQQRPPCPPCTGGSRRSARPRRRVSPPSATASVVAGSPSSLRRIYIHTHVMYIYIYVYIYVESVVSVGRNSNAHRRDSGSDGCAIAKKRVPPLLSQRHDMCMCVSSGDSRTAEAVLLHTAVRFVFFINLGKRLRRVGDGDGDGDVAAAAPAAAATSFARDDDCDGDEQRSSMRWYSCNRKQKNKDVKLLLLYIIMLYS